MLAESRTVSYSVVHNECTHYCLLFLYGFKFMNNLACYSIDLEEKIRILVKYYVASDLISLQLN